MEDYRKRRKGEATGGSVVAVAPHRGVLHGGHAPGLTAVASLQPFSLQPDGGISAVPKNPSVQIHLRKNIAHPNASYKSDTQS